MIEKYQLKLCNDLDPAQWGLYRNRGTYVCDGEKVLSLNLYGCAVDVEDLDGVLENPSYHHLVSLNLSATQLRALHIPALLKALRHLDISENPALASRHFEAGLPALETLLADESGLTTLTLDGAAFPQLKKLVLRKNALATFDLPSAPPALEFLDISENQLSGALSLPKGLNALRYLYLNENKLQHLSIREPFKVLEVLHLRGYQLTGLPSDFLGTFPVLTNLYLYGNPLPETLRGTIENDENKSSLEFVKNYLWELRAGHRMDNECKVLLIGNGNVGKTCLVERLAHNRFVKEWASTHAIVLHQLESKGYLLNLWDFAGQDIYHATHRMFMQSNAIYLVLWDEQTENKRYTEWEEHGEIQRYENFPLSYWLDYAKSQGKGSPVVVVQTKIGHDGKKRPP